jgi:hypothetical protein
MRKILIIVLILIVTMSILWVFAGRQISSLVDQYRTAEVTSQSIQSIGYEGSGDGGTLIIDDHRLILAPLNPHVGSTKENELALANAGKVFAFGRLHSSESLAAGVANGDTALFTRQRSYLAWPSFNEGRVSWNRADYYKFTCNRQNGAKLEMLWSVDSEKNTTSLIRINIADATR